MSDWPSEYDTMTGPKNPGVPHWTRDQARRAGRALANRIFADRPFAENYLSTVRKYYGDHGEYLAEYLGWIEIVVRDAELGFDTRGCNANDFANCHRAAWLYLANAFAFLVDKCPHVDNQGHSDWGNPPLINSPTPHYGISRGEDDLLNPQNAGAGVPPAQLWLFVVHNIPNASGLFNISTMDVAAAPVDR